MAVDYHTGAFPPPSDSLDWSRLIPLLGPVAAAVARYDGTLGAIPNASILLSPLTTQEAVLSSRIEGTQATMGEVLEFEADGDDSGYSAERRADIYEVLNYRMALLAAENMLEQLPLSQRVIREAHKTLLSGVRGENKSPGEYRRIPNWIGPHGCSLENARYIPIAANHLPESMSAWEKFIHDDTQKDRLVQLAILHAEFEALHPFLDGNGRLGRMLVPLYLWKAGLIKRPMFYISAALEQKRDEYYERLLAVSRDNDWTGWCCFFLEALQFQANDNLQKASAILTLYNTMKGEIQKVTRSQFTIKALDCLFRTPVFTVPLFVKNSDIPASTAKRILTDLRNEGILKEIVSSSGRRAARICFPALLNIAEGKDVF